MIRIKKGDFKRKVRMSRLRVLVVLSTSYTLEASVDVLKIQMGGFRYSGILKSASLDN